jgi:hypothetical protein
VAPKATASLSDPEIRLCETASDQVMEKVDSEGNVLGFSVLK